MIIPFLSVSLASLLGGYTLGRLSGYGDGYNSGLKRGREVLDELEAKVIATFDARKK